MRLIFDTGHIAGRYTGLGRFTAALLGALLETSTFIATYYYRKK